MLRRFALIIGWALILGLTSTAAATPAAENPFRYRERLTLPSGQPAVLRPYRASDAPALERLFERMTMHDRRLRFFAPTKVLPRSELARNDARQGQVAFVLATTGYGGELLGVARSFTDPRNQQAEYAIMVDSNIKRQGIGRLLTGKVIDYARHRGTARVVGDVLAENQGMLGLAAAMGFARGAAREGVVPIWLDLKPAAASSPTPH